MCFYKHVDYIPLLQEPKAPVWGKLSMPRNHEGESDRLVQSSEYAPPQVSYHDVVLILTPTVVRVEVDITLAEPMYFEEVVQHADDGIGPFTYIYSFVDEVIDLAGYSLATNSKYCTFSRSEEVHWARLEGVVWVEHLLSQIKGVVSLNGA